jgi:hypothetical protein
MKRLKHGTRPKNRRDFAQWQIVKARREASQGWPSAKLDISAILSIYLAEMEKM